MGKGGTGVRVGRGGYENGMMRVEEDWGRKCKSGGGGMGVGEGG